MAAAPASTGVMVGGSRVVAVSTTSATMQVMLSGPPPWIARSISWRVATSGSSKADSGGQVVIYRGINDRFLGFSWSSPYQPTGIQLAQVPQDYQQTVATAGSMGSQSQVTQTIRNIRAAVDACRTAYLAQQNWVTRDNAYNAYRTRMAAAKAKHPTGGTATNPGPPVANPGPPPLGAGQRPSGAGGLCPPATAFNIPASALTPTAPGSP